MSPGEKKQLNVLFLTPYYLPTIGGAEVALHNLCEALNKIGVKPFVLTHSLDNKGVSREQIGNVNVFRYSTVPFLRATNALLAQASNDALPIQHIEGFYGAYKIIKKYKIDLVHVHYFRETSVIGYFCKKIFGKPMITHLVGDDIYDPIEPVHPNKWHYYATILKNSSAIVAASAFIRETISINADTEMDCKIIPYGVDTHKFKPVSQPEQLQARDQIGINNGKIVIAVQRLDPRKKVEVLLRAAKIVVETLPATKFIIVGDGPERQRLISMKKQLGLESHVEFTLKISDGDLIDYLSIADVFSIHTTHEGFGIVYIEAMSMGLPIVTSRANGNEGLIENGKNGFMVPPNDPYKLAEKIIFLLQNDEIRKNMSEYNRNTAEKDYDLTVIANQWATLYRESLSRHECE